MLHALLIIGGALAVSGLVIALMSLAMARALGRHLVLAFTAMALALLALPAVALADTGSGGIGAFISGQAMALAVSVIVAPLLGVLAHKYLPALEGKVVGGIDASPFFQRHQQLAGFGKLFIHDLDLQLIKLNDQVVADAKASGKFDANLAELVKKQAIAGALEFVGQSNRDALAQQLGFQVPGALDSYLNRLLEGRLAELKASGVIPSSTTSTPAAPGLDVPSPSKAPAAA